jgi:hypothetical protein
MLRLPVLYIIIAVLCSIMLLSLLLSLAAALRKCYAAIMRINNLITFTL